MSFIADVATLVGYTVVSKPFLDLDNPKYLNSTHGQRLEVFNQPTSQLRFAFVFALQSKVEDMWIPIHFYRFHVFYILYCFILLLYYMLYCIVYSPRITTRVVEC